MTNYIDAEKLIAEIDKRLMSVNLEELGNNGSHRVWAYNDVKDLITFLRQEQPKKRLIQVKCLYPHDESWQKNKVYTCEVWHHGGLNRDFWDVYYDYGKNPKYVQFPTIELLNEEFVITQEEFQIKQEQPEVDLEKELIQWHKCHFKKAGTYEKYSGFYLKNSSQLDLARYFYKIGLSARKEVDIEKEIQEHIKECLDIKFPTTDIEQIKKDVAYTARKFYELGLNAREK